MSFLQTLFQDISLFPKTPPTSLFHSTWFQGGAGNGNNPVKLVGVRGGAIGAPVTYHPGAQGSN